MEALVSLCTTSGEGGWDSIESLRWGTEGVAKLKPGASMVRLRNSLDAPGGTPVELRSRDPLRDLVARGELGVEFGAELFAERLPAMMSLLASKPLAMLGF
jgi:hypothetical protein